MLARFGGDEFVILLHEVSDVAQVSAVARRLLSAAVTPIMIHGRECRVTASIGVAKFPDHGTDEQSLTKNADAAMYLAKEEGRSGFRFFSREIKTQSVKRLMLETSLRRALERDKLVLRNQAKQDLATGEISGVEALLRWQHPDLGVLPPIQFISLAEIRTNRADRQVGAGHCLRAEHGLAGAGVTADARSSQPFATSVHRS